MSLLALPPGVYPPYETLLHPGTHTHSLFLSLARAEVKPIRIRASWRVGGSRYSTRRDRLILDYTLRGWGFSALGMYSLRGEKRRTEGEFEVCVRRGTGRES